MDGHVSVSKDDVERKGRSKCPSPTYELFASDEANEEDSMDCSENSCDDLDECIDASRQAELCSIASLIHGRKPAKRQKKSDLKPIAFVRFNTKLGKPKPVTIRALLDSGGSQSLVTSKFTQKLRVRKTDVASTVWTTPSGPMTTNAKQKRNLPSADKLHSPGAAWH